MFTINPKKLLLYSISVWTLLYVFTPVTYLYEGNLFFPIFILIGYILCFFLGLSSIKQRKLKLPRITSDKQIIQIIFILFSIGAIGVLLKLYVGVFKTEIFVTEDVFEQRLENMGKELSGGLVGLVASLLFPFAYVTMLLAIFNYKILNKVFLIIIVLFGLYPFIETLFMGGRTIIALLGTTLLFVIFATLKKYTKTKMIRLKLFSLSLLYFPKFLLKKIILIPLLVVGLFFVVYSIKVVDKRLTRFGYGDYTFKVWEQKDYQWVKFDNDFKQAYFKSNPDDKARMIGLYSLKHYFVHGVIEYVRLVNHLDKTTGYYYGQYEFNVFFKFFKAFGIPLQSLAELNEIVERKAVYQTFWGPFYIDFGVFGFIIMLFWGRFVRKIQLIANRGYSQYIILYAYLSTVIITSIFINFLQGSSSYYLFALLVTLLVFKFWPNNLNSLRDKHE